ncbi:hypothetical protein N9B82_04945 [Saprospiraceae bacterium]|nr:hypothetical protein [Saprospiraceae bacterium]
MKNYTLRRNLSEVKGSFEIKSEARQIGLSFGETAHARYVKIYFDNDLASYAITQETRKHYKLLQDDVELAMIKLNSSYNLDEMLVLTNEGEKIRLLRQDRGQMLGYEKYVFFYGELVVGFLTAKNWNYRDVKYELEISCPDEIIHGCVVLLGFLKPTRSYDPNR